MNLISDGGISSKNSPNYTTESFLINQKNYNCNGYKIDISITKDNKLIAIDSDTKKRINISNKYIESNNYADIKKLNIGTKVKKNNILLLDKIIPILNLNTNIFLLIDSDNKINEIIGELNKFINKHKNYKWNILCNSKKALDKLLENEKLYRVGIIIEDNQDWNYSVDFYYLTKDKINSKKINEKISNNIDILIDGFKNSKEIDFINKLFNIENKNIYIIDKNINRLDS